ncbi:MAG: thiamine biosynthesis lipoprotein [Parcubacteria bacterium C7867-008]|nr:MAG: thiamine biosynthesis lipoprotein [Parcubacteria bacterium C7867-008]
MEEFDYEKRVMGSEASISIVADDRATSDVLARTLFEIAEKEEARFSRFRKDSELSRLNSERAIKVSAEFMDALLLGRELYRKSSGVFNPLVDISRFGYDADISVIKGTERTGNDGAPYNTDMEAIHIDQETMSVSLQVGQNLDFGGFIKAHTAEKMAMAALNCQGVLVNLGGDIYARGLDAEGKPFVFMVQHPTDPNVDLSFIATNVGIATSGSYNRHWKYRGTPFFHILDSTGSKNPITEILSATIISRTGAEADAYATAALALGAEAGGEFLTENGCEYCFILTDGSSICSRSFPMIQQSTVNSYA